MKTDHATLADLMQATNNLPPPSRMTDAHIRVVLIASTVAALILRRVQDGAPAVVCLAGLGVLGLLAADWARWLA